MMGLKSFAVALVSFLLIDFVWLALVAKSFYIKHFAGIGRIEGDSFKILPWAGILVYVFMSIGLIYFVLPRVRFESSWLLVFLTGALFGLVSYGIYDMTNLATLKDWDITLALVDMAWGTFLCGLVTVVTKFVSF